MTRLRVGLENQQAQAEAVRVPAGPERSLLVFAVAAVAAGIPISADSMTGQEAGQAVATAAVGLLVTVPLEVRAAMEVVLPLPLVSTILPRPLPELEITLAKEGSRSVLPVVGPAQGVAEAEVIMAQPILELFSSAQAAVAAAHMTMDL